MNVICTVWVTSLLPSFHICIWIMNMNPCTNLVLTLLSWPVIQWTVENTSNRLNRPQFNGRNQSINSNVKGRACNTAVRNKGTKTLTLRYYCYKWCPFSQRGNVLEQKKKGWNGTLFPEGNKHPRITLKWHSTKYSLAVAGTERQCIGTRQVW